MHTLTSYFLVALGLLTFVLNYQFYSEDFLSKIIDTNTFINNFELMILELKQHIKDFFIQYYEIYIININLDDYKAIAIAVKALFSGFRDYFMNIITLLLFIMSSYIKTEGNFYNKIRKPFQMTIFITIIYVFLLIIDNLNI